MLFADAANLYLKNIEEKDIHEEISYEEATKTAAQLCNKNTNDRQVVSLLKKFLGEDFNKQEEEK